MRGQRMLKRGRKLARERMDSTCLVTRPGTRKWDEDLGDYTFPSIEVYAGECRVKHSTTGARKAEAGGQLIVVSSPEVHFPAETVGVEVGDLVEITGCQSRPSIAGRRYKVKEPVDGTQVTALRFRVEVADGR